MASSPDFSTPMARARGLGSAKAGTDHHIRQRVSAIALIFLVPWFLYSVIHASQAGFAGAQAWVAQPWNAILLILTFGAAFYHMRLGMQVVIEDYINKSGRKSALLIANTFATLALFAVTALSVLKIWISVGA
ncbi:MAG: succinate dehydrogenase, hydrophobic membrane anchor protein [Pseudomonadota bacterium]